MKFLYSIFLIGTLCLYSCKDDDVDYGYGAYYVEIVTALGEEVFLLDNGLEIVNVDPGYKTNFRVGERVQINFSYISDNFEEVKIRYATKMPLGELQKLDLESILIYPDDPVKFESSWIGSHYFNVRFYIERKSEVHTIELYVDESTLNQEEIDIYFLHDAKNDSKGSLISMKASFNLVSILGEPEGNRKLRIYFNTSNLDKISYLYNY